MGWKRESALRVARASHEPHRAERRAAGVELGLLTARGGVKRRSGVWRERQERDSASRKCSAFEVAPHCVATSASVRAGMGSGWSFRSMNSERASSGSRISGGVDGETKAAFPTTSARSRRGLGEVSAKSRRVSVGQSRLERCDYLPTSPHISRHISPYLPPRAMRRATRAPCRRARPSRRGRRPGRGASLAADASAPRGRTRAARAPATLAAAPP